LASAGWRKPWISASDRGINCCSDIFFYLFSSALPILINFTFICFQSFFFLSFRAIFCFINPSDFSPSTN
jgi:hypothetical protein